MKEKINSLNKNKYLVPVIVFLVLVLLFIYSYNLYKYDIKLNKSNYNAYKNVLGQKISFELNVYKNSKGVIKKIESNNDINFDSNPIFLENNLVIFPRKMNVVFPYDKYNEYVSYENLVLERNGNVNYLINNGKKFDELYFFLFDGLNSYFFINPVDIYINDVLTFSLGESSYISLYDDSFVYYDKSIDKGDVIDVSLNDKIIINDKYINLDLRSNKVGDSLLLSTNFDSLSKLSIRNSK